MIFKLPMRVRMMMGSADATAVAPLARAPSQLQKTNSAVAMLTGATSMSLSGNKTKMLYARVSSKQIMKTGRRPSGFNGSGALGSSNLGPKLGSVPMEGAITAVQE